MRRLLLFALVLAVLAAVPVAIGYRSATSDPVVRRASVSPADWPARAAPVTIALLSDVHIGNAAMDRDRFARIATAVTALKPDLIVLAGDFIAGHEPSDAAAAPELAAGLARLRAPLGVVAVLGNHDHKTSAARVRAVLEQAGVTVLVNGAVRRGPLAVGGVDDLVTHHDDLPATRAAMAAVGGARVLVSHSPDVAPRAKAGLVLAGHTHCGQMLLPLYGSPVTISRYGDRYLCGLVREGARTTIVTAGVGTSMLPLRWGAPPDLWLVRVGP
jgi:predicted MPP superfamily phosphohydrolase